MRAHARSSQLRISTRPLEQLDVLTAVEETTRRAGALVAAEAAARAVVGATAFARELNMVMR
jgi:hypothetical protein